MTITYKNEEPNLFAMWAEADKKAKDDEVDALAPADVDDRFERWMRDKR